jgi:hypothetical protein
MSKKSERRKKKKAQRKLRKQEEKRLRNQLSRYFEEYLVTEPIEPTIINLDIEGEEEMIESGFNYSDKPMAVTQDGQQTELSISELESLKIRDQRSWRDRICKP